MSMDQRGLAGLSADASEGVEPGAAAAVCLFRSLGDPARLRILLHLALGEHRVVEPYRLGLANGRALLSGWQRRKGWRTFGVDAIEALEVTTRHFDEPREGFAADPRMDRVIATL